MGRLQAGGVVPAGWGCGAGRLAEFAPRRTVPRIVPTVDGADLGCDNDPGPGDEPTTRALHQHTAVPEPRRDGAALLECEVRPADQRSNSENWFFWARDSVSSRYRSAMARATVSS